ncbi:hypothetical protein LCGC14_0735000 [marine sediment metagenome]|uniref:Uncharacterized protein n=1 Tax=marine sediment metagenome TaxID=412755 RepID=A0A0F9Q8L2_9ZZZZ
MPHTSTATRRRSNNPRTRNTLLGTSPFARKLPGLQPPNRPGGARTFPTFQPPTRESAFPRGAPGLQPPVRESVFPRGVPGAQPPIRNPLIDGGGLQDPFSVAAAGTSLTSALGPGGQFLVTSDNPFTQSRFGGQVGGGTNIPTIAETTPEGADRQRMADLQRFDRLGFAKELDRRRGITLQGTGKTGEVAKLLATDVQNNPFISPEGLGQLQRGLAPLLNQIDPAFFRHTNPIIVQSMLGLLQSLGVRPESVAFQQQAARPEGF